MNGQQSPRHRGGMTISTKIPAAGQGAPPAGRIRAAWAAAHAPAAGVPRWARVAAYAVPFTVLPSSAWRIAACAFHAPIVRGDVVSDVTSSGVPGVPLWLYVILLSIVSELLAFTAVGLVSTWGEVFPRWIPVLRGRRVPALGAVVPAALGAAVLTLLWTWVAVSMSLGLRIDGRPAGRDRPGELRRLEGPRRGRRLRSAAAMGAAAGRGDNKLLEAPPS